MNVLENKSINDVALVRVLAMLEAGTYVRVRIDEFTPIFMKRIRNARDVLDLCEKVTHKIGHHPRVYEIGSCEGAVRGLELWCR